MAPLLRLLSGHIINNIIFCQGGSEWLPREDGDHSGPKKNDRRFQSVISQGSKGSTTRRVTHTRTQTHEQAPKMALEKNLDNC